jgi:AmmeMemoRadiSam system protein B/AmmeMemoRadiSam system protein A
VIAVPVSDSRGSVLTTVSVATLTLVALGCRAEPLARATQGVRPAAQAGRFYPGDAAKLRAAVTAFMKEAAPPRAAHPLALVVPHAGYVFSGQIAADAFRQAAGDPIETVVILGTNHTKAAFDEVGVSPAEAFQTPLGNAPVDGELRSRLLAECRDCVLDEGVHAKEHSVEVQVPFVQVVFPEARILPLVVGADDEGLCQRFGQALARVLADRRALIVASSDLSHYPAAADADVLDHETLQAIASLDIERARRTLAAPPNRTIPRLATRACGAAPILAAMTAARALGATRGAILSYASSGRTSVSFGRGSGEDRVVGYGAVAFTAGEIAPGAPLEVGTPLPGTGEPIGLAERRQLLVFARETIRRVLETDTFPLPRGFGARLWQRQGVFVTLKKKDQLRGCIGRIPAEAPLAPLVGAMAYAAAFEDRRFSQLSASELPQVTIEISALTPPRDVKSAKEIVVGRDGVVLGKDGHSAVFLPQVATEMGWGRDEMLDRLCEKAGLAAGCWKAGARFSVFQAEVFHEE